MAILLKTNVGGRWVLPQIRELTSRGCEVLLVVADEDGRLEALAREVGARTMRARALGGSGAVGMARGFPHLLSVLRRFQPDVINYHLYRSALVGRVAGVLLRVPTAHSVPGPLFLESRVIKAIEHVLSRLDTRIIASSGAVATAYRAVGYPERRVSMVPYGIDLTERSPGGADQRMNSRHLLGIDEDEFVVTCVAYFYAPKRLTHKGKGIKGHDVLFEAWRRHKASGGRGLLLVVGGGFGEAGERYRDQILFAYRDLPGVMLLTTVPDVSVVYFSADVSVSPSRSENYGAPWEAGAFGVPSIASAVGGLPEIISHGESGWLVPPSDAEALSATITTASRLDDGSLRAMGALARRTIESMGNELNTSRRYADTILSLGPTANGRRPQA